LKGLFLPLNAVEQHKGQPAKGHERKLGTRKVYSKRKTNKKIQEYENMRFVTIMSFLNTHFLQLQQQINHIYTLIYNKYRQLLYAEYFLKNEALKTTTKV
jgi:hypothetical protein